MKSRNPFLKEDQMKTLIAGFVFGGTVGLVITVMTGHPVWSWQWWAGCIPIYITATIWKYIK